MSAISTAKKISVLGSLDDAQNAKCLLFFDHPDLHNLLKDGTLSVISTVKIFLF